MKEKTSNFLILIGLVIILVLAACAPKQDSGQAEAQMTHVAETVAVQFTKTAIARPSDTPMPSATSFPTATSAPTQMPTDVVPTAAVGTTPTGQVSPTTQPTQVGGVDAGIWARSNPEDGTNITAGSQFSVVVTLMNTGTTTWTPNYYIQMTGGDKLGLALTKFNMPYNVPPQMSVQFTFEFTAPNEGGTVKNDWSIVNPNDVAFGVFWCEYNIVIP
ncbi:MAG: hypothetical protein GX797_09875 [Chloroflexi bacterium]|jgi:hypothetical protein|nr:hypothetical protein [Chloroflexota bacterium]